MTHRLADEDECRLQEGIYIQARPGHCYRLLLLDVKAGASQRDAARAIGVLWQMLGTLRAAGADLRPPEHLTCLLGFGVSLFDRFKGLERPRHLEPLGDFDSLAWVAEADRRAGEADLVVQLIGETDLAVDRAVVEAWMLIEQTPLPLEVVTFHGGFNRDDGRSWLGFHDGISNIERDKRRGLIEVPLKDPPWMLGGTYMAFLRLAVDLVAWRRVPRHHQEMLVGRDKVTGCPLASLTTNGRPRPLEGCPVGANPPGSERYIDPPRPADDLLARSHIHRTNKVRGEPDREDDRIFRQGYEFLEPLPDGRLRLGLNFVSFQKKLANLTQILRTPGWLSMVNFGGVPDPGPGQPEPIALLQLIGGGYYAVPPTAIPFPGAEIF